MGDAERVVYRVNTVSNTTTILVPVAAIPRGTKAPVRLDTNQVAAMTPEQREALKRYLADAEALGTHDARLLATRQAIDAARPVAADTGISALTIQTTVVSQEAPQDAKLTAAEALERSLKQRPPARP